MSKVDNSVSVLKNKGIIIQDENRPGIFILKTQEREISLENKQYDSFSNEQFPQIEKGNASRSQTFLHNDKYDEIFNYVFTREKLAIGLMRFKLPQCKKQIPEVLTTLIENNMISFVEGSEGSYQVCDSSRIWYYVFANKRRMPKAKIMVDLKMKPDQLETAITEAKDKRLIRECKVNSTICYEAILK